MKSIENNFETKLGKGSSVVGFPEKPGKTRYWSNLKKKRNKTDQYGKEDRKWKVKFVPEWQDQLDVIDGIPSSSGSLLPRHRSWSSWSSFLCRPFLIFDPRVDSIVGFRFSFDNLPFFSFAFTELLPNSKQADPRGDEDEKEEEEAKKKMMKPKKKKEEIGCHLGPPFHSFIKAMPHTFHRSYRFFFYRVLPDAQRGMSRRRRRRRRIRRRRRRSGVAPFHWTLHSSAVAGFSFTFLFDLMRNRSMRRLLRPKRFVFLLEKNPAGKEANAWIMRETSDAYSIGRIRWVWRHCNGSTNENSKRSSGVPFWRPIPPHLHKIWTRQQCRWLLKYDVIVTAAPMRTRKGHPACRFGARFSLICIKSEPGNGVVDWWCMTSSPHQWERRVRRLSPPSHFRIIDGRPKKRDVATLIKLKIFKLL